MTSIEQTADSQWDHLNCYCEHDIAQEVSMLAVMEQVWIVVQSLVFQYYTLSMMMPSYEWLPQTQVSLITNILELLRRVLLNPIQSRSISNNNGEREFTISMLSLNDCTYMYRALAITSWKHVTKHFRMAKKYCAQWQLNGSWCLTHNLCAIFTGSTQRYSNSQHNKNLSSKLLSFLSSLYNRPLFCHTDTEDNGDNREKSGEIYSWFTVVTSIARALYCCISLIVTHICFDD